MIRGSVVSCCKDHRNTRRPEHINVGLELEVTIVREEKPNELFTTSGASSVSGLPSGSRSHWKP